MSKPETSSQKFIHVFIGGSFDPVHKGHTALARLVHNSLQAITPAYHIYFLPTAGSPFKNTRTTPADRVTMLELAITDMMTQQPSIAQHISIDTRELNQSPPVYSVATFTQIRQQVANDSVIFVMGKDSLASLPRWKDGFKLLSLCHLWVFDRGLEPVLSTTELKTTNVTKDEQNGINNNHSSENLSNFVPEVLKSAVSRTKDDFLTHSFGNIFLDVRQPPAISSSYIRDTLTDRCHKNDTENLLSLDVWKYIQRHQLYQTAG